MTQVIVPTIGRKIWLWLSGADRLAYEQAITEGYLHPCVQPLDASICYTHSAHLINVVATDADCVQSAHMSVELIQAGTPWDQHTGKHCQWMPFQVKAASEAKTAS